MKILILCTGNSCRSQMAESFLRSLDKTLEIFSAGTHPEKQVNPNAMKVMAEAGIDISTHKPDNVDIYIPMPFDYVITVCDSAKENCPIFIGKVKHQIHIGFDDPVKATGTEEEILNVYRRVRDEIKYELTKLYDSRIKQEQ